MKVRKFNKRLVIAMLEKMVARDGIEPPMPAFSEPLTVSQKWFGINGISFIIKDL